MAALPDAIQALIAALGKMPGVGPRSAERIAQAAALVTASREKGHHVAVVTSAMSGVTNSLIAAAQAASSALGGS